MFMPQYYKIVSGVGKSKYALVSFDNALRNAGIGDFNIVKVSSILPINCKYSESIPLKKGSILYAAYATITVVNGEVGQTAVAVAIPDNDNESGVIFETSSIQGVDNCEILVQEMCCEAMKSRNKNIKNIEKISQKICAVDDNYYSAISAIVMW